MDQAHIVNELKNQNKSVQEQLFKFYSPILLGIARRYTKNEEDAEDVCLDAFYKIFTKIDSYKGVGNFEGWMKKILVNEALMFLRKNKNFNLSLDNSKIDVHYEVDFEGNMDYKSMIELLKLLPTGYRTVFNLYVIEGFKHREIAEQLGISINTSKSQLILAKKRLREIIKKKHKNNTA